MKYGIGSKSGGRLRFLIVSLVLSAALLHGCFFPKTFVINESEIQHALNKSFPVTKTYHIAESGQKVTIKLENPKIKLKEGSSKVSFSVDGDIVLFGIPLKGPSFTVSGDPVVESNFVCINNASIDDVKVSFGQKYVEKVLPFANKALVSLNNMRIYKLPSKRVEVKSARVENGKLVVTLK